MLLPSAPLPVQVPVNNAVPAQNTCLYDRTPAARTAGKMPVWGQGVPARQSTQTRLATADEEKSALPSGSSVLALREDPSFSAPDTPGEKDEGFGFFDLLDIVNPLQHLPVVGFVYREITGDTIKPVSRIAGGGLYGGLPGAAASMVNVAVEEATGRDIAGNVLALVERKELSSNRNGDGGGADPESRLTRIAQAYADLPGSTIGVANLSAPHVSARMERDDSAFLQKSPLSEGA